MTAKKTVFFLITLFSINMLAASCGKLTTDTIEDNTVSDKGTPLFEYDINDDTAYFIKEIDSGNMPVSMELILANEMYSHTVTDDSALIQEVIGALKNISVVKATDICVTDSAHGIIFTFENGKTAYFSFEYDYYRMNEQNYEIKDYKPLYTLIEENVNVE